MEHIWEHLAVWGMVGACLSFGGVLVITAVAGYVKRKPISCAGRVVGISAGTALMAVGLFYLLDLIRKEWIDLSFSMVLGIVLIMDGTGMGIFLGTGTRGMTKWLFVVLGVVLISLAVSSTLRAYRY
jgi:hypothetical protein